MALDILVVDDELDIRELVAGVMEDEGFAARAVCTRRSATSSTRGETCSDARFGGGGAITRGCSTGLGGGAGGSRTGSLFTVPNCPSSLMESIRLV